MKWLRILLTVSLLQENFFKKDLQNVDDQELYSFEKKITVLFGLVNFCILGGVFEVSKSLLHFKLFALTCGFRVITRLWLLKRCLILRVGLYRLVRKLLSEHLWLHLK